MAERFVAALESAVESIIAAPDRCRVVEEPAIRRYVFNRFPYMLYYRWDAEHEFVTIFALMHCSRQPGFRKNRIA